MEGFDLTSQGTCRVGDIANCFKYFTDEVNPERCKTCKDFHYRSNDDKSCIPGLIPDCKVYKNDEDGEVCEECQENSVLIPKSVTNNDYDYCLKDSSATQCNFEADSNVKGELTCLTCKNINGVKVKKDNDIEPFSQCLEFFDIPFCEVFSKNKDLISNAFVCDKCEGNHYLDPS